MNLNLWEILAHMVNLAVLYFVLRKLVYKPVLRFLNERAERLAREREAIESERQSLEQQIAARMDEAQRTHLEAVQALKTSMEAAQSGAKRIEDEARDRARDMLEGAREQTRREQELQHEQMQSDSVQMALDIAQCILRREVTRQDNERIIRAYFSDGEASGDAAQGNR